MYRRYRERRRRHRAEYRPRSVFMRPSVQVLILLVAALIVFIILSSGGR